MPDVVVIGGGLNGLVAGTWLARRKLSGAIQRVLRDGAFRRPIPAIQSSFQLAGGARRAADVIEHFVAVGAAHHTRSFHGA